MLMLLRLWMCWCFSDIEADETKVGRQETINQKVPLGFASERDASNIEITTGMIKIAYFKNKNHVMNQNVASLANNEVY